ncbi:E3 ubiquitin/ISG15 ligase TRIM25 isoform X2 [Syngnathoides biaculeatus]|uniref:E3 ubiquitin/ISG15 ligase TRIM25 isoform X2 n=1 Tax=Syngnathoides biaculeatus TaxID=300417 RepID=UPI002ADD6218|nr:E3 ubiquitin/ISG15 ligase TRIM25 isoform X2 [Syngnathoides biaculeatus]
MSANKTSFVPVSDTLPPTPFLRKMADVDDSQLSLLCLGDDLTCSICLCTFDSPVTIPCGHNFCQECILATWKESNSCPQCRTRYPTKPEVKKNTVLSAVVETFNARLTKVEADAISSGMAASKVATGTAIRCDSCMEAEAVKTCLTCMASYCDRHLRPHRDSPMFRVHQLTEPIGDLLERICPDHHKLMELFCTQHDRLICTLCLQQVHKTCDFITPEQQRTKQESNLRQKLGFVDKKIKQNEAVVSQMADIQQNLQGSASTKKFALAHEYQQIRDMLVNEERAAMIAVDQELESSQTKLRVLMKRFSENITNLSKAKVEIQSLLGQSRTMAFLQASLNLPKAATFDPYAPRINLDSKKLTATEEFAVNLKKQMCDILSQPLDARLPLIKTEEKILPRHPIKNQPPAAKPVNVKADKKTPHKKPNKPSPILGGGQERSKNLSRSMENLLAYSGKLRIMPHLTPTPEPKERTETMDCPSDLVAENRHRLLMYGTALSFDPKTAHKRIVLSESFTRASVSDQVLPAKCDDWPERFSVCSQVLASQGFTHGCHYWEVQIKNNNFTGIGLAYSSIDRKGPTSRLGRNAESWCVEWFNIKLSAWHNSNETVVVHTNPKRVGVLLDFNSSSATFYNVADRAYPFYSFVFPFTEAVYPAFWIFSSESSISLCKLNP